MIAFRFGFAMFDFVNGQQFINRFKLHLRSRVLSYNGDLTAVLKGWIFAFLTSQAPPFV